MDCHPEPFGKLRINSAKGLPCRNERFFAEFILSNAEGLRMTDS
jgi:hypothetical protein